MVFSFFTTYIMRYITYFCFILRNSENTKMLLKEELHEKVAKRTN